jgi:hypothetical protein
LKASCSRLGVGRLDADDRLAALGKNVEVGAGSRWFGHFAANGSALGKR